jgi:hypothetical protein
MVHIDDVFMPSLCGANIVGEWEIGAAAAGPVGGGGEVVSLGRVAQQLYRENLGDKEKKRWKGEHFQRIVYISSSVSLYILWLKRFHHLCHSIFGQWFNFILNKFPSMTICNGILQRL